MWPKSTMGSHPAVKTVLKLKKHRRLAAVVGLAMFAMVLAGCSTTELPQNTLDPASERARDIDGLFTFTLILAGIVFVLVQGAIIYTIFKFRRKKGEEPRPVRQIHGNTKLEIAWTIAPALILAGLAVPTVQTIFEHAEEPIDALEVTVTGHQWWWEYDYPDLGVVTANEPIMPNSSPSMVKMKSVCFSGRKLRWLWVPCMKPRPNMPPEPSAIFDCRMW